MSRILFAAVLLVPLASLHGQDVDGKAFSQLPEVLPTSRPGDADTVAAEREKRLQESPLPKWVWGAKPDSAYFVRKTFAGGTKSALLTATCDNRMTVWLNGQQVAESGSWERPVQVDVRKYVREGENELLAEVRNEGGASGFLLKLLLEDGDTQSRAIVTDETWTVAETKDATEWMPVRVLNSYGEGPWGGIFNNLAEQSARGRFNVPAGFQVERLFTVPGKTLGSWVCLAIDNKGRILASDQGDKGLCRITPAPPGSKDETKVEHLEISITAAQGMLYAFDSLYLSVNGGPGSGLYRARDTDGDDQFDEVVKLRAIPGGGEHGPHSLVLSPDGQSIYMICGNHTRLPDGYTSRIPSNWNEDHLLPRQWDANGHATGVLAPGGWIVRTDRDGQAWDVVSMGYRNPYDMAFNADGELFAYDADMEWDMGSPWYRPTRVVHATSGSEFGWRSGTGKWPEYYPDSLPPMIDIGPGSPVGVTFGHGTKFPPKYQKALYILDWTFGTMYAVHLEPDGASYTATKEEFVSRTPLPLTDAVVGADGALYFSVGGRGTQSELFRVTYVGDEPTDPVDLRDGRSAELRLLRNELEKRHGPSQDPSAVVEFAWKHLGHSDRFIRYAARIAVENQPAPVWQSRVTVEQDPQTLLTAAIALSRQGDKSLQPELLTALGRLRWESLSESQQLELLRAYQLVFLRMGEPSVEVADNLGRQLDERYPAKSAALNRELCNLLVYLKSPSVIARTLDLLRQPTVVPESEIPELLARNPGYGGSIRDMLANQPDAQKMHYVFALRNVKAGWSLDQRKAYFDAIAELRTKKGGASYQGFLRNIDREAFENASEPERLAIEASGARPPFKVPELPKPVGPGKAWTLEELVALGEAKLKDRDFKNGEKMFAAARCVICHRFAGDGGATGPDLTQAAGRFQLKDLSEAIVDPGKIVSDQYRAHKLQTKDGLSYVGRLIENSETGVKLLIDPEDPTKQVAVSKDQVEALEVSDTSLMPRDLLLALNEEEVLDLLAYLLSRGNARDSMFRRK